MFAVLYCCFLALIAGLSTSSQATIHSRTNPSTKAGHEQWHRAGVQSTPQYDAQKRPITAGGFVDSGTVVFEDITKAAGLSDWIHKMGVPQKQFIVETNGSGVCLIDYNNDGWLDIYLVTARRLTRSTGKSPRRMLRCSATITTAHLQMSRKKRACRTTAGATAARLRDYDNDGWPDLYVGNYGKNRLYHNNHDGTFTDVAKAANVALGNWSPGSTWGDYDGDGKLDLYVTGYVHFDRNNLPDRRHQGGGLCILPVSRRAA